MLPASHLLHFLAVDQHSHDLALGDIGVVAEEFGGAQALAQFEPDLLVGRFARAGPGGARSLALAIHRRVEAGIVDRAALAAQNVLRQVEREAERVVELEGDFAVELALGRQARGLFFQKLQAAIQRLLEAGFLQLQRLGDQRLGAAQFGIGLAHLRAPAPAPAATSAARARR